MKEEGVYGVCQKTEERACCRALKERCYTLKPLSVRSLLQRCGKESGLDLGEGRTDEDLSTLKVFYLCYQCGSCVSHSHSGYYYRHPSELVSCLGHYHPREFSALMGMFQGCMGADFYWLGGVGCFIFGNFMSWLLSIIMI